MPRLLALDSSQLGLLSRDTFSNDPARSSNAKYYMRQLDEQGYILVISYHHIQELLSHDNEDRLSERVKFLRSLPIIASIASLYGDETVGSIVDVQAREVRAAYAKPAIDVLAVREEVASQVFRLCSGNELMRPFLENWSALRSAFTEQRIKNGERVAILRSNFANLSNVKIVDLLHRPVRSPNEINKQLANLQQRLTDDMKRRGDRRIADADTTAAVFLEEVRFRGAAALDHENPAARILTMHDIDLTEVTPQMTVADAGALGAHRSRLRILNRSLNLPWDELRMRVSEERLPSGTILSAVARFHPDTREWDGSEMTDRHLVCLSAYADVTFVDKRMHEALRQARLKSDVFTHLVQRIEKVGTYIDSLIHLNSD